MGARIWFTVENEDGSFAEVQADQREFAAFEGAEKRTVPEAMQETPFYTWRFLAFHALKRTGQIDVKTTRAAWDGQAVEVSVGRIADNDGTEGAREDVPPVGPGRKAATGAKPSSSRSRAASPSSKS